MVFRGLAGGKASDIDELQSGDADGCLNSADERCNELSSARKSHDLMAGVGNATLIASGVLAAATAGYVVYVLAAGQDASSVKAGVGVDGTGATITFAGSF